MGVINITPDSFYDGGQTNTIEKAVAQAEKHLSEGATFLDIGGYSSRPDAPHISEEEELNRVLPVIREISTSFPDSILSVDTFRSRIAEKAVEQGAAIINDISAGDIDPEMLAVIAALQVPYIAMHMKGTPQTMQNNPNYGNVIEEIIYYFSKKIDDINCKGINDVILDVGFGFGKSIEDNYQLLNQLSAFKLFKIPILTGVSRKSMLYKPLEITPEKALNATSIAHTIALQKGSNILRVHDVKAAIECIRIVELATFS
ncbi:MAG: dihydropteroate synthase [Flavobacteriales bacterium]|nr:dihydropteroate synthase [Flavobacteriales bacterium]